MIVRAHFSKSFAGILLILSAVLAGACSSNSSYSSNSPTPVATVTPVPAAASTPAAAAPSASTAASSTAASGAPSPVSANDEIAVVETNYGTFKIKFYPNVAPKHVEHFKQLVREKFYDGLAFHRVAPNYLVQGGDPNSRGNNRQTWGLGQPGQPTVPAEFNSMKFLPGIVGAARKGDNINSATSQFFIALTPHPEWDGLYTVFGDVFEGLDVVRRISNLPLEPGSERPRDKAVMRRVYLTSKS